MSNSAVQIVINWPTGKYQLFIFNLLKNASSVDTYIAEKIQYSCTISYFRENISCTAHTVQHVHNRGSNSLKNVHPRENTFSCAYVHSRLSISCTM
jgi:hypothetical protein